MIWTSKHMVRVLAKGGILTPSYLLKILDIVKASGNKHVHFGSRQDVLFQVSHKHMPTVWDGFEKLQTNYVIHGRNKLHAQNIVSSYIASDMMAATPWLSSGNYLYILEHFSYQPVLRVNIVDPKQSLVPLFYGHLNFIASPVKDYWYLYIRRNESALPGRWPVLVLSSDIGTLSKKLEEHLVMILDNVSIADLFSFIQTRLDYNWRKIEKELAFEFIPPHEYEGFGKMYNSQNYWAGFFWRNNNYDVSFLEEVCRLCLQTNISKICLTPWKSFLIKEIQEKDLFQWHRLLGRFGINMHHSSFELNWHLPLQDQQALRLKRYVIKEFDKVDVCVHGLTFSIKAKPELSFTSVVIERVPGLKFLKKLDPFVTYKILYAKNFNVNTCQYEEYMPQVPRYRLPQALQELTIKFFAQLQKTSDKQANTPKVERVEKHIVHQCQLCFSIYDEKVGDPSREIAANTPFAKLPDNYCCSLCEAPKADFKVVTMDQLIKTANA